jgi:hypothetical protein
MTTFCDYLIKAVKDKLVGTTIRPPTLRRQIAGNLDNPYDMEDLGNVDIRLYVEQYLREHSRLPPAEDLEQIAIFPTSENLSILKEYLALNLSKL